VTGLVMMLSGVLLAVSSWAALAQAVGPKVRLDVESAAPAWAGDIDPDNPYANWFFSVWSTPILADGEDFGVITAVARDANNGPLTGKADQLSASLVVPEAVTRISDFKPLPNAPGSYRATITSTRPGDKTVEVKTEGYPVAVKGNDVAHFVSSFSQEVSLEKSSWTVAPEGPLAADGESSYTGVAAVRDTADQPVAGKTVTFTVPTGVTSSVLSAVTNAQGEARAAFASTLVGVHSVSAGVDGVGTIGSVDIAFIAGEADARTSSFTLAPTALFVGESATASAVVKDSYDHPVRLQEVTFAATGSAQFPSGPSCQTDDEGTCTVTVTDAVSEDVTVTASLGAEAIAPVAGITVSFTNKQAVPGRSELVVTPVSSLEVGQSFTATVTARDADGAPAPEQMVLFHLAPVDPGVLSQDSCVTDSAGTCSVSLKSKLVATLDIHASLPTPSGPVDVGGNSDPAKASPQQVEFVAGEVCVTQCTPVDSDHRTRADVIHDGALADGVATNLVRVVAYDSYGNPVEGAEVRSTPDEGSTSLTVQPDIAPTDKHGVSTISYTSAAPGAHKAQVFIGGETPAESPVTVSFRSHDPDPDSSEWVITPAGPLPVGTDALSTYTATASVRDPDGNLVEHAIVTFSTDRPGPVWSGESCFTDSNGACSVSVHSTASGTFDVTASVGAEALTNADTGQKSAPVTWKVGEVCSPADGCEPIDPQLPADQRTGVKVSTDNQVADGSAHNIVTVRAFDKYGNPIEGAQVESASTDPALIVQTGITPTGKDGSTTVWYSSLAAGPHEATLSVNGHPVTASPVTVHFVPGKVCVVEAGCQPGGPGQDPSKQTRVAVTTNDRPVSDLNVITGYAFDKYGNPTSGVVFSISSEYENLVFSTGTRGTGTMTSREDGTATVSAGSDKAGSFSARGSVAGAELTTHGSPLDLRFLGAPTITFPVDGGVIKDKPVLVTGVGQNPGATVTVKDSTGVWCTTTVQPDHTWTCPVSLPDGKHALTAVETTTTGEISPPSNPVRFTLDTQAPPAPVITKPGDHDLTNHSKPVVTGTGSDPGNTVTVRDGDVVVCTAAVKPDLTWSCTPGEPLADGDHTLTADETDQAGNVSDPSQTVTIQIDTQPPAAPVLAKPDDKDVSNQPTPEVSGTGQEPGNKLAIRADDKVVCRTVVKPDLTWSCTLDKPLADGNHTLKADETDKAGNVSQPSNTVTVTVDTEAPRTPTITTVGKSTIAGVAEPGSTLTGTYPISESSTAAVATAVDSTKNWSMPTPSDAVSGTITAVSTDKAGNNSPQAQASLDLSSPGAPIVHVSNGSEVSGTAEPGSRLDITDDQGKTIPGCEEVFADVNGRFTCAPEQALSAGTTVTVRAEDKAGNVSPVTVVTIVAVKAEVTYPQRHRLETQVATGFHFNPGEQVCLSVVPSVQDVGCQTADTTGKVTFSFTVPQGFQTGQHTVTLTGYKSGLASTSFAVVDTVAIETGGVVATPVSPGQLGLFAAVALLGAGASGVWFGVRRVSRTSR